MKKTFAAFLGIFLLSISLTVQVYAVSQNEESSKSKQTPPVSSRAGKLKVSIIDTSTGQPTPARIRLRAKDGSFYRAENRLRVGEKDLEVYFKSDAEKQEDLFYSPSCFEIELPAGKYNLLVEKGFEYSPWEKNLDIPLGQTLNVNVELARWVNMPAKGWMSGDYHIHLDRSLPGSSEQALEILKAEDLKIAYLMLTQFEGKLREVQPAFGKAGSAYSDDRSIHAAEEFIHDTYGHLAFINIPYLIEPVGTGARRRTDTKADYPTNFEVAKKAKDAGAVIFACHGGAGEFPIDLALGVIDGIEVIQGSKWERVTGGGKNMLLAPNWYHALNCGFKIPGTAASDYAYLMHKVVNLECNYVYVKDDFSPKAWLTGLKQGRSFMAKGPVVMDFTVNGRMMGDTINLGKSGHNVDVLVRVSSLYPLDKLQILRNGVVIREIANKDKKTVLEFSESIPIRRSSWLAARAFGENPNKVRGPFLIHSNPVYLEVNDQPVLVADSVVWWLDKIDDLITWVENKAVFDSEKDKKRTLEIYRKGRRYYEDLLAKCSQ